MKKIIPLHILSSLNILPIMFYLDFFYKIELIENIYKLIGLAIFLFIFADLQMRINEKIRKLLNKDKK